jgi:maltooligosyltrehalose trehalohydrolase
LTPEQDGYFSGLVPKIDAGCAYRFRLDSGERLFSDPASRFQPQGPHGSSQVIDSTLFLWTDQGWKGVGVAGQVVYEMHIGTFTPEGTWASAERELASLAELGITCLEVMPVADFAGRFGWGYDGVNFFAPTRLYGAPDDFRRFVDRAHALGMGVILDVVYNHFGPDGNHLREFAHHYFTDKHCTAWGDAINFDDQDAGPVRDFFLANVRYWIEEFHIDGYRFDATQAIKDDSPEHILAAISREARQAGGDKSIYLVNENEPQEGRIVRPARHGGYGMDALWNDDFHHSAMVLLAGRAEAYYTDYCGRPQEFISAAKYGYLFQGQPYKWQRKYRGTPTLDLPPTAFVNFIQNHDQVANSARGQRAHQLSSPGDYRAMTALLLLMPQTPMLFQGQEFAASSTFHYFADHNEDLSKLIRQGREKELCDFPSINTPSMRACLSDPTSPDTFARSKLDRSEREKPFHRDVYRLHKDLLKLRREEAVFRRVQRRGDVDGAVIGPDAFILRYFGEDGDDRLLLVNFGSDLHLDIAPEPLLAPPQRRRWSVQWTSEDPSYGGCGAPAPESETGWNLTGRCAMVLKPDSVK